MRTAARTLSSGYTLIEMMVSLSLLGLIGLLLSGSFQFGARTWELASQEANRIGEVEAAQSLLRRQVAQSLPFTFRAQTAEPEAVFAGGAQDLRFAAPLSFHQSDAGPYVFALGTGTTGSTEDLVLQWQVYRPDRSPSAAPLGEPLTVVADIAGLRLAYYGRVDEDSAPVWQPEWRAKGMPMLVRIDIAFPRGDRRSWPTLIVALKSRSGKS